MKAEYPNHPRFKFVVLELSALGFCNIKRLEPEDILKVNYPSDGPVSKLFLNQGGKPMPEAEVHKMQCQQRELTLRTTMIPTNCRQVGRTFLGIMGGPTTFFGFESDV